MESVFGKKYKVNIKYPVGSEDEEGLGIKFEVAAGTIEGVTDAQGDPQVAYVLDDSNETEYVGELVAIIHRLNDYVNLWVISNKKHTKEEIKEKLNFIEKYYRSEIII